jgi:hypothetical protein
MTIYYRRNFNIDTALLQGAGVGAVGAAVRFQIAQVCEMIQRLVAKQKAKVKDS